MNDNGSITIKKNKFRKDHYVADTVRDRDLIRSLGFPYSIPESQIDNLISKASEFGLDIREEI